MAACSLADTVYRGRDNPIDVVLLSDGAPVDLSPFTRWKLAVAGVEIDSDVVGLGAGEVFDASGSTTWKGATAERLRMVLGGQDIPVGRHQAWLTGYSAAAPAGIVWGALPIVVVDPP